MSKSNIIYTPEAQRRLEKAIEDYVIMLVDVIKTRKYYPGDEYIEVTASDIEVATKYLVFRRQKSVSMKLIIIIVYMVSGVSMTVLGLFYESLIYLLRHDDPIRLMLVLGGLATSIVGLLMLIKIKIENQEKFSREMYIRENEKEIERNIS